MTIEKPNEQDDREYIITRSGRKLIKPTPEEDAEIQRGIDADPDNPEWTAEDFARARPFRESVEERRAQYERDDTERKEKP